MTMHGWERVMRMHMTGMPGGELQDAIGRLATIASSSKCDMAVHVYTLPKQEVVHGASNGEMVVGIIRDGVVTTVMLRRASQPFTAGALRVSKVMRATK